MGACDFSALLDGVLTSVERGGLVVDGEGQVLFSNERCLALTGLGADRVAEAASEGWCAPEGVSREERPLDHGLKLFLFSGKPPLPSPDPDGSVWRSEAYLRLLHNLERINRAIAVSDDVDAMLEAVLGETLSIFGCDRAWLLYPCDPEATEWSVEMEKTVPGFPGLSTGARTTRMTPVFAEAMRKVLASPTPVAVRLDHDPDQRAFDSRYSVRSRLLTAVYPRIGKPWLFGLHQCGNERVWTVEERQTFFQIAQRLSDGLSMRLMIKKVSRSEERLSSIVASMADWVWECDRNGVFTKASARVEEILGYPPEEVVGRSSFDFMPEWEATRVREELARLAREKLPIRDLENWNITKDGRLVCIVTNGAPILDGERNLIGYRGVDKDVTTHKLAENALRESEARFKDLFTRAAIGIIFSDSAQRVLDANPEALKILGYTLEEFTLLTGYDVVHPDDLAARPVVTTADFGPFDVINIERRFRHRSGEYLPVFCSISKNRRGEFMIMFQDLSALRRMERQLLQAQKMEAVGTLSSGIAHDFNNILQSILGFSQIIADEGALPDKTRSHVARIESSVSRGATLVRNLLSFARSEKPSILPLEVNREVTLAAEILSRTLPKMISIRLDLAADLPPVAADPTQFEQLLLNLATNARDAMGECGVLTFETATLRLGEGDPARGSLPPGDYVRVVVADTGCGMSEGTRARIFEPFFTTKEVGKGTGLGLSTVYGIVVNHRGAVRCDSAPGEGTRFTILLPAARAVETRPSHETPRSVPEVTGELSPVTVLVADDEEDVRDVAVFGLERLGFRTIPAKSGEEAIELLSIAGGSIDVVLLDLSMPGMGGEKALGVIRARFPAKAVVVASGNAMSDAPQRLMELGAVDFVRKPYRLRSLADAIARAAGANTKRPCC